MQQSTETRWFIDASQANSFEKWFNATPFKLKFPETDSFPRQDYYMNLPGISTLGLKIREPKIGKLSSKLESKIEAKVLVQDLGTATFLNSNSGKINRWTKFSFDLLPEEKTMMNIINALSGSTSIHALDYKNFWIRIDKNRLLLTYDNKKKEIVDNRIQKIDEGCGIELTKMKVRDHIYYSFGLEAFSSSENDKDNLFETLGYLFNQTMLSDLPVNQSLSYPEFINSLDLGNIV